MLPFLAALCLALSLAAPSPATAAFEWTGPAATRHRSPNPADLAARGGWRWTLRYHRQPGLPQLTAHAAQVARAWGMTGVGVNLASLGPAGHRETSGIVGIGRALPAGLGSMGVGTHLFALYQEGLPVRRSWAPSMGLLLTPGSRWRLSLHGRGARADLTPGQLALGVEHRSADVALSGSLGRSGHLPWRLHLTARYRLSDSWGISLRTRSAPRQFGLALSWSRDHRRLRHGWATHPDLGPTTYLEITGGVAPAGRCGVLTQRGN